MIYFKKVKSIIRSERFIKNKPKTFTLVSILLLLLVSYFVVTKLYDPESYINCKDLTEETQKMMHNPYDFNLFTSRYEKLKPKAQNCRDKTGIFFSSNDNAEPELLNFYRNMAVASSGFGDYKDSKKYADKALKLNERVDDSERLVNTPKAQYLKIEMEAIKNNDR